MKKSVAKSKSAASAGPRVWTVTELGAFYTEHRSELLAHANRVLKNSAKAEEITQDALIKFMLAAPELESEDHGLSYLHRTIENLCIDLFRLEGRRPHLVVLDDATAEVEASWQNDGDHSAEMSAAEDAAIIRQALAILSPAERAALVMWEMEGRSTAEIAAELGIKESAVRHTVSRARASMRRILSELIIDEERGLTALDMLSTTYKKAADVAQKSSKVALSLLLVVTAFLGFNSLTGGEGTLLPTAPTEIASGPVAGATPETTAPDAQGSTTDSAAPTKSSAPAPTAEATAAAFIAKGNTMVSAVSVKGGRITFAGLDKNGIPTGFTVTDGLHMVGELYVSKNKPVQTPDGTALTAYAMTVSAGPNVLLDQIITTKDGKTTYSVSPIAGIDESWMPLEVGSTTTDLERLSNGEYLMTVTILIDSSITSGLEIPIGIRGWDLSSAPTAIITRILLNSDKSQILAQAVAVNESNAPRGSA